MITHSRRYWATRLALALSVAVFFISALSILPIAKNAGAYSDITINFECPAFGAKAEVMTCKLTITGGPAGDFGGNFSYKAEIIADNETGSHVSPSSSSSASGVFNISVTMPGYAPQTIKIRINVTSEDFSSGESSEKTRDYELKVIDPIVLRATVYNTGAVDAKNVTAKFYADGEYLGMRIFDLGAGASTVLTYNWTWVNIDSGRHTVTVVLDGSNDLVEFSNGNNVYTMTVYVGDESNPLGAVLTVGVIIMSVMVFLTFLQKPSTKKK
ncbi:MAG: hypothetical protein OEM29_01395 [Thermoplasmata archaeon]|nr:hypothetical protein [Thermoplasmata archaeon]